MMPLADDERREQEFTVDESHPCLLFGVPKYEPGQPGLQRPQVYDFAMGISNCRC